MPSHRLLTNSTVPAYISSSRMGLKSDLKVVGNPQNIHTAIAPMTTSCQALQYCGA